MKLLTFSVAAYNVETYLPKLFETLLDRRCIDRIEILIINDGSSDKTAQIAEQYQTRFPDSVRLVNKENGGHGSTINKGIGEAAGRYFRALDGDDWVDSDALCSLLEHLESADADVILTNYYKCYPDGHRTKERFHNLETGRIYAFEEVAPLVTWMCYHTVIYKTDLLKKNCIHLDEHCFYVDSELMILPIPYVNTVAFYDYSFYCYRLGLEGQSVSPTSRMKHAQDSYTVANSLLKMYDNLSDKLSEPKRHYIEHGIAGHCTWHFRTILTCPPSLEKKKEVQDFDKLVRNHSKAIYNEMEQFGKTSQLLQIVRRSGYLLYYPAAWIVRRASGSKSVLLRSRKSRS